MSLDGRVCVVTGAGRGIGRAHALLLAAEGARVVVNDLGIATDGSGGWDAGPAEEVASEIRNLGGQAVANTDSVADWQGSRRLIHTAIESFGDIHVVVNNAGILRNRGLVHLAEDELDTVLAVHVKGHLGTAHWAAEYWRDRSRAGHAVKAAIINTASGAMLGTPGLIGYTAAKAGIAAATLTMAIELARYGVRANCVAPIARTRMAQHPDHVADFVHDMVLAPDDPDAFDLHDPANVSPLVAYLATQDCPFTGGVFHVGGNEIGLFTGWSLRDEDVVVGSGRWTVAELADAAPRLLTGRREVASLSTTLEETMLGVRAVNTGAAGAGVGGVQ